MKPILRVSIVAFAAVLSLSWATPASAQQLGDRPYQGLFGGGGFNPSVRHSLEFEISMSEAYDDDVPAGLNTAGFSTAGLNPAVLNPGQQNLLIGGYSTMITGNAQYRWRGGRWDIGASAASVLRYYSANEEFRSTSHIGSAGFTRPLTATTTLTLNQTVQYSPSYLYSLFPTLAPIEPGELPPGGSDYGVIDSQSFSYNTNLVLDQRLSARNSLSVTGEHVYTDFSSGQNVFHDLRSTMLRGDFTRKISRMTGLTAAYAFRAGDFGYGYQSQTTEHGVDVGMEFIKRLSATRSAVFGFTVGGRTLYVPKTPTGSEFPEHDAGEGRSGLLSAEGTFSYQFGRSWAANGTYRRGVDYVAGFPEPVLTGGFTAGVGGFISDRVEFEASGGYATGDSALNRTSLPFDSYTGQARVRIGLAKSIACYAEYIYYYYLFSEQTQLTSGFPSGLERNGIRVGLTVWVPAFRK